jgi:hypothetical protein
LVPGVIFLSGSNKGNRIVKKANFIISSKSFIFLSMKNTFLNILRNLLVPRSPGPLVPKSPDPLVPKSPGPHIPWSPLLLFSLSPLLLFSQEQVDVGIFENTGSTTFYIKARPSYTINGLPMTNAQLTIRWEESSGVTDLDWLGTSIGLIPQGDIVNANGYNYKVYASTGGGSLNWTAGNEYTILTLAPDNQDFNCAKFEIALDDWTANNNGDFYFEVVGEDRTGIRYEPYLNYGSEAGYIDGDTNIYLGESTGLLRLEAYNGIILTWQRNADQMGWLDIAGTAGETTYEEIPSPDGTYQYRAMVQLGSCPANYSIPATVAVELLAVWTGAIDTVWENFGNWNTVGIPDAFTDAMVPEVPSGQYPAISQEGFSKKLTVGSGATLTVSPTGELSLSSDLRNNGLMRIRSDLNSTGSLLNEGAVTGTGDYVYLLENQTFYEHHISAPVAGSTAGNLVFQSLYSWNEPNGLWNQITDPSYPFESFRGYCEYGNNSSQLIPFIGESYHSGIYSLSLTNNGGNEGHAGGFNLAGNPYPSAINWNSGYGWVRNQVDPVIYVYNGDAQNFGTYIKDDPASSTLGVDSIIGVGQGFFVHVSHDFASGDLAINNSARLHDHRKIMKSTTSRTDEPLIRLMISQNSSFEGQRDEVVVRFRENTTKYFDDGFDAYDLTGLAFAPQLFTRCPDTLRLAVNTFPPLTENIGIPMGLLPVQSGNFILKVTEMSGFGPDTLVFLEDLKWNQLYPLVEGTELPLLSFPGDDIDRFVLHFQVEPIGVPEESINKLLIFNNFDGKIHVFFLDFSTIDAIFVTDLSGRLVYQKKTSSVHEVIHFKQPAGLYLMRVCQGPDQYVIKFFSY